MINELFIAQKRARGVEKAGRNFHFSASRVSVMSELCAIIDLDKSWSAAKVMPITRQTGACAVGSVDPAK